ncbi:MAG: hypothetical protein U9O87_08440 [Verrucomicrobiota bacterium]|nr:hypothetical protein [Verrucomicrobiota bacterium]
MAKKTLDATWKQFERVADKYFTGKKPSKKIIDRINRYAEAANKAKINNALQTVLIDPYLPENVKVSTHFYMTDMDNATEFPEWIVRCDFENETVDLNPIGVFLFLERCEEAEKLLKTREIKRSFIKYRYNAFLTELKKLPPKLIFFLIIIFRCADARKITEVEKKNGEMVEAEGRRYLTLLSALKELESLMLDTKGLNLRQEYAISWYESDWIVGE